MANLQSIQDIDWIVCELNEQVSGKVSSRPVGREFCRIRS